MSSEGTLQSIRRWLMVIASLLSFQIYFLIRNSYGIDHLLKMIAAVCGLGILFLLVAPYWESMLDEERE